MSKKINGNHPFYTERFMITDREWFGNVLVSAHGIFYGELFKKLLRYDRTCGKKITGYFPCRI
jgi:hypothetical protein